MRLEVSRRSELAVRALTTLAAAHGRMKAPALADALGTTAAFVPQVVGPLVKAGWVRSDPGPTGGYALHVSLESINVLQVVEALDGAVDTGRCVVETRTCNSAAPCMMHVAWSRARSELERVLGDLPLTDLTDLT